MGSKDQTNLVISPPPLRKFLNTTMFKIHVLAIFTAYLVPSLTVGMSRHPYPSNIVLPFGQVYSSNEGYENYPKSLVDTPANAKWTPSEKEIIWSNDIGAESSKVPHENHSIQSLLKRDQKQN